jgi:hypothetical protein
MKINDQFQVWLYNAENLYSDNFFTMEAEEITDELYLKLLVNEYIYGIDHLLSIESALVLLLFAKISYISSSVSGMTLGEMLFSESTNADIVISYFDAVNLVFTNLWVLKSHDEFIQESFRVHWDNIFLYGGDSFMRLITNAKVVENSITKTFTLFKENTTYSKIIDDILNAYMISFADGCFIVR